VLSLLRLNPWLVRGAVGMVVPIYEGGALIAQVKIATAQQQQAVAGYGSVVLTAFREVENALTNQVFLAERSRFEQGALADSTEAVRIGELKYKAGAIDLLSVLQLQAAQLASQAEVIKLRNAQLANRINLHLALGGSFDASPATTAPPIH